MKNKKQYAVIGLGKFGGSVARTLNELGHEVLGIDIDEEKVQAYSNILTHVVIMDARDEESLYSLGLRNFDAVVVANNHLHGRMLEKIGADKIIYPDIDMGQRVAHNIASSSILDFVELDDNLSVVEFHAPRFIVGHTLAQTRLRNEYEVNVVALKNKNGIQVPPSPHAIINADDVLILVGKNDGIRRLEALV